MPAIGSTNDAVEQVFLLVHHPLYIIGGSSNFLNLLDQYGPDLPAVLRDARLILSANTASEISAATKLCGQIEAGRLPPHATGILIAAGIMRFTVGKALGSMHFAPLKHLNEQLYMLASMERDDPLLLGMLVVCALRLASSPHAGRLEHSFHLRPEFLAKLRALRAPEIDELLRHLHARLAIQGRAREMPADLREHPCLTSDSDRMRLRIIRLQDAVECGRCAEAAALLPEDIDEVVRLAGNQRSLVLLYHGMLMMMQALLVGRPSRPEARDRLYAALEIEGGGAADTLAVLQGMDCLAWGGSEEVEHLRLHDGLLVSGISMYMAQPLRHAALLRNAPLLRRLLAQRRDQCQPHFIEPAFEAMACWLEQDLDGCAAALQQARARAAAYDANGRLDFELRLCRLFSPGDLFMLGARSLGGAIAEAPCLGDGSEDPAYRMLVGESAVIERVRDLIRRFAGTKLPVLISGPTGSGKEVAARALHACSPRAKAPFVALNCAALAENLLESELFGHRRGAFSGADRARAGLVAEAGDGSLFLDEIGDAPPRLQAALLRLLESGEYRPVGSDRSETARCRIITATNIELPLAVAAGRFRQDLYYRLCLLEVRLPALSQRPEDVLPLILHFLGLHRAEGQAWPGISSALANRLRSRTWPGNVRELRSLAERLHALRPDSILYGLDDLDAVESAMPVEVVPAAVIPAAPARDPDAESGGDGRKRPAEERLLKLRELFRERSRLTRRDICAALLVSSGTATSDLARLVDEGFIRRVEPNRSPNSHYFMLSMAPR